MQEKTISKQNQEPTPRACLVKGMAIPLGIGMVGNTRN
jgi:hypothetical protein